MPVSQFVLNQLSVGQAKTIRVDVTEKDIDAFSTLSGDVSPIHVDAVSAKQRGFTGRVAHGLLIGAYVSRFIGNELPGANGILREIEFGFKRPLVPPQTIEIEGTITHISEGTGQVTIEFNITDTSKNLITKAKAKTMVRGPIDNA